MSRKARRDHAVIHLQLLQAVGCDKLLRQVTAHFTAFTTSHYLASGLRNSPPDASSPTGHEDQDIVVCIYETAYQDTDTPFSSTAAAQQASACQLEDSSLHHAACSSSGINSQAPEQGALTGRPPKQAAFWRHAGSLASKVACIVQKALQRPTSSMPALTQAQWLAHPDPLDEDSADC